MSATLSPEFGRLAPNGLQRAILSMTRKLPSGYWPRRIGFLLRRIGLASMRRPVDIDVFGFRMRLDPRDNLCEKRVLFTPQFYDVVERSILLDCLHERFSFVDIGANVGIYSMFVAAHAGTGARIVAVEPDPDVFARLAFNLQSNGFGNIIPVSAAIGEAEGRVRLVIDRANRGRNSIAGAADRHDSGADESRLEPVEAAEVRCLPLLALFDETGIERPDAIKIDVEGVEMQVLAPFFAAAPVSRWPRLIILESREDEALTPAAQLVIAYGYQLKQRSRMNAILARD